MSTDQLFKALHVGAGRHVRLLQPSEPCKAYDPNLSRTRSPFTATSNDIRRPCLCAIFCILVCWSFAQEISAQSVSPYEQAMQRAMATMYAINYDKAAQQFKEAIKVQPENPRAYLYLSTCHWMNILYLQNRLLSTVFSMPADPYTSPPSESFPPQFRADFEDAVRSAKEKSQALIKAQPQNAEGYFWLGMAEGSESVFIISVDNKLFAAKGHADKSFDFVEQAVKLDPEFKDPFFSMGMHMHLLGTRGFLTRVFLKMMGYKVSKEQGRRYVELAMNEGRYVRDDARMGLILCHIREANWAEAVRVMQTVLKKYPQNSLLAVAMARLQSRSADHNGAARTYQLVLQRMSDGAPGYGILSGGEIHLRYSLELLAVGRTQEALAEAEKAVGDAGATHLIRAASHLALGQARDLLQNRQGAIAAYQAVLALTPATPSHEKARQFLSRPYDGKVPAG
jgi:tetratricopeptide (TPR) repeat protein